MLTEDQQGRVTNKSPPITTCKVDVPNTVLELEQTPVFECCVVGCESKTRHHKDMC